MTEFESKIYQIIQSHDGIKGNDIADLLGVDKSVVNSTLFRSDSLKVLVRQESDYTWHPVNKQTVSSVGKESCADKTLHDLCNYYLRCISTETNNEVSQFLTGNFLKYSVLNGLGIDPTYDRSAMEMLSSICKDRSKKAFVGYPVHIFSFTKRSTGQVFRRIAPVFLFPVDFSEGSFHISWSPEINLRIIKSYCSDGVESICRELLALEKELGLDDPNAAATVDELVLRLKNIRDWNWKEDIDPYNIPPAQDLGYLEDGFYNRPIIIEAEKEIYTQGLVSELMSLSTISEEQYRGTALHSWIKNEFVSTITNDVQPLLEVLPLNSEQAQAVETALRSDLTIVTGPPGTGKSQVVTDLLLNIAWNNKSVLFSSKNNKAVDVVETRVNALSRRPVLLRLGSDQMAGKLAAIVEDFINSSTTTYDHFETDYLLSKYNSYGEAREKLLEEKEKTFRLRNKLDDLEQAYSLVRDSIDPYFDVVREEDAKKLQGATKELSEAFVHAQKKNQSFVTKLLWPLIEGKRKERLSESADIYNGIASRFGLDVFGVTSGEEDLHRLEKNIGSFSEALAVTWAYKNALRDLDEATAPEDVDRMLANNKIAMASVAEKLWDKWQMSQKVDFSGTNRKKLSDFIAAMRLAGNDGILSNPALKRQYAEVSKCMTQYLRCWAITSLSVKNKVPFEAGLFDYVVIDEAGQCDIASMLPLLYRAKRAVIIGDSKQLNHITKITKEQDLALLNKYQVELSWSYSAGSIYSLAAGKVRGNDIIQLRDHFRSHEDIIQFSNEYFYSGSLRTATKYDRLKTPAGDKPGVRWIHVSGSTIRPFSGSAFINAEVVAVVKELKRLAGSGYVGTIGVTTPFKAQSERINEYLKNQEPELYGVLVNCHEFIADTVHKFQGDERDLMIFSAVVSNGSLPQTLGFLSSTGNLFNVAITRARAELVVVGDFAYCGSCEVEYLRSFAEYCGKLDGAQKGKTVTKPVYYGRTYPKLDERLVVSDWEKILYTALYDAGIRTVPQHSVEKYRLDLALFSDNGRKLDIEVDGEMYHRRWNGELEYLDQIRNQRMFELGWDVKRFWVYQVRDEMPKCIDEIKKWLEI